MFIVFILVNINPSIKIKGMKRELMLILIIMDLDNVLRIDSPILTVMSTSNFKREKCKVGEDKSHLSYDYNKGPFKKHLGTLLQII